MDLRPVCKYGENCYRQNVQHQKQYQHPTTKRKRKEGENTSGEETVKKTRQEGNVEDREKDEIRSDSPNEGVTDLNSVEEKYSEKDSESEKEEEEKAESPVNIKENIKAKYLVDFPEELYLMWNFCNQQNSTKPEETFTDTLDLTLVGPFDILAGKHKGKKNKSGKKPNFLLHWRYYYDPPELTTIMNGDITTQFHIGYYRDDPNCMPDFVASNSAKENGCIRFVGENLFSAIKHLLEEKIKTTDKNVERKKREKQLKELCEFSKKNDIELDYKTTKSKRRDKNVVSKTLHGAGIVVPIDENGVGYRPVPETPGDLKKMFKRIVDSKSESERDTNFESLQELITYIQFANDECDYGEGLELGLDLFTYGGKVFHATILTLLPLAYQLLGRHLYAKVIDTHLKHRKHTSDLSQLG